MQSLLSLGRLIELCSMQLMYSHQGARGSSVSSPSCPCPGPNSLKQKKSYDNDILKTRGTKGSTTLNGISTQRTPTWQVDKEEENTQRVEKALFGMIDSNPSIPPTSNPPQLTCLLCRQFLLLSFLPWIKLKEIPYRTGNERKKKKNDALKLKGLQLFISSVLPTDTDVTNFD